MAVLAAIDVEHAPDEPITTGYELATAVDETLVVLYVMSQEEFNHRQQSTEELPEEFQNFTLEKARDSARSQATDAVQQALDAYDEERVENIGRVGTPEDEILAVIEDISPRYVVVGGRKRSPVKQTIFGSVSQEIVRKAEPPVVTLMEQPD